ncbi:MAG: thiamine phosphate synthase [Candidatus Dormibacteraceae bacterium]
MAVVDSAAAGLRSASRATILQLRAPRLSGRELEHEAAALVAGSSVPVIVSSRCDVALAVGAAGVNLPGLDISARAARVLMRERLVGRSVHSLDEAVQAEREGADFVIFGPVWPSPSHPHAPAAGPRALAELARAIRIQVVAIGGVTPARVAECRTAGAAGYAAISMFK